MVVSIDKFFEEKYTPRNTVMKFLAVSRLPAMVSEFIAGLPLPPMIIFVGIGCPARCSDLAG
jgi:hypothetical protein